MNRFKLILLTATIMLAMAFTFSCSSGSDHDSGGDSSSSSEETVEISSSSSSFSSSSLSSSSSVAVCNGIEYDTVTHFCQSGTNEILPLCGGQEYIATEQCCGNSKYVIATEYCSKETKKTYDYVTYDGQTYKAVEIGAQTWMAENLNYNAADSKCYNNDPAMCDICGRLYSWTTAMATDSSSTTNPSGVRGICPEGWHLPSIAEWDDLMNYVQTDNGSTYTYGRPASIAGEHLKAKTDLNSNGNGLDTYDFNALMCGIGEGIGDRFSAIGNLSCWWSSTVGFNPRLDAYNITVYLDDTGTNRNTTFPYIELSVRCVKD
jgi:uncharacterized protein (TIGR02145 family)